MSWIPPVRARLGERFIFNFRMAPGVMRRFVPAAWLAPQEVNGFAVASFCILDLRGITVAPLAPTFGLASVSCAPRYAVLDCSAGAETPAVFVTTRWTSSAFGAWLTSLGFSAPHPHARARIARSGETVALHAETDQGLLLDARVAPGEGERSRLFASAEAFAGFIAAGVSSYGTSRHGTRLTRVDLRKSDHAYTPLRVERIDSPVVRGWVDAGAVLDSAFHTSGGVYEWRYHGLTPHEPARSAPPLDGRIAAPGGA